MESPFLLGLVIALAVLTSAGLSRVLAVPYPVFLVLAGLVASFVPGAPVFDLRPDVVFYVFLPPLLYYAAFLTSPRALRRNWKPIGMLAVGLVLVTMTAVAFAARAVVPELELPAAFVLGAIVAPTDPVAATAVIDRLGASRRLSVVLEAEGLLNDGIALVLFGLAVSAATSGSFSVGHGILRFAEVVVGGVAWGAFVGWAVSLARRRVHESSLEITLSLFTPFIAYIPADRAHVSGVLATVAAGLFLGSRSEGLFRPGTRLQARAFWDQFDFLLNSVLFVLLGLQFRHVVAQIPGTGTLQLVWEAAAISAVVIGVRALWQFVARVPGWAVSWQERLVIGWGGMRGVISLAAALSVPLSVGEQGFQDRAMVLFLTFAVILATLVVQGVTLPYVIRRLRVGGGEGSPSTVGVRIAMIDAALERVDELAADDDHPQDLVSELRERFERERRLLEGEREAEGSEESERLRLTDYRAMERQLVQAQRDALNRCYREGRIDAQEVRALRRELDLEASLLG